jgi:hypothetical protein
LGYLYCFVFYDVELENAIENSSKRLDPAAVSVDIAGNEGIELQEVGKSSAELQQLNSDVVSPSLRPSLWQQLAALMKTRFLYEKRIKSLWYIRLIQPVILLVIGLLLYKSPRLIADSPYKLKLESSLYVSSVDNNDTHNVPKLLVVMNSSTSDGE